MLNIIYNNNFHLKLRYGTKIVYFSYICRVIGNLPNFLCKKKDIADLL